ncbi:MAG: CDP-alcohol phosphatidyltransferase family protein [Alphaproteobacteria bacterium]
MKQKLIQIKNLCKKYSKIVLDKFYTVINFIAKKIAKVDVNANFISITGFIIGLFAINFVAMENYFYGLLFFLINRFFDVLDGAVAKISPQKSDFGVFLDASLDYIFYAGIIFGFALANPSQNALASAFLLTCFCAAAASMLAYGIIAFKKDSDKKLPVYLGGTFQAGELVVAIILMCLAPSLFMPLAIVFGIISLVKAFSIIISAYYAFVINK